MSGYPDDTQYEDKTLTRVEDGKDGGWLVYMDDGWSCFIHAESPIRPQEGMTIRLYGKGIGYPFRGMFLDGNEVFYRNETDDEQYRLAELYGRDAADRHQMGQGGRDSE